MEADAIADGFKQSLEMNGLKYNKLIGTLHNIIYKYFFFKTCFN